MAKRNAPITTDEVLRKVGAGKRNKKAKAPKRTPSFLRYKAEKRWVKNQVRQIEKHLTRCPNDTQSANRLKSIQMTGGLY